MLAALNHEFQAVGFAMPNSQLLDIFSIEATVFFMLNSFHCNHTSFDELRDWLYQKMDFSNLEYFGVGWKVQVPFKMR